MSELGFRYRPSAQADLDAHAHTIRLLTEDLADVPPSLLERAAQRWAVAKPFMPKASELIELARELAMAGTVATGGSAALLQAHCDQLNAAGGPSYWFVAGEAPNRRVESKQRGPS